MRCTVGSLQVVMVCAICCADSIFAYSPLPLETVIARVNRVPHTVSLPPADGVRTARIIGGSKTTIEDVPYQVSLRYFNNHICGGSIISHSWVLTAAHCLDWYPNNDEISVRSGSTYQSTGGSLHAVFYYHLHEHYDMEEFQWDVATIRVRSPMVTDPARAPIPLSPLPEWSMAQRVTVAGWGYLASSGKVVDSLQMVRLDVVPREICNQSWTGYITDDMICAGGPGVDACAGDSGGPAVQDGLQYGIVSWGAIECGNGLPGVYTSIAHPSVRNFIRRTTMV
ncbi:trypsin epsilon-like [Anopheles moucheti]|uniref:trypsin epsilon-like n=1 Tax=Anopheles moucheti TaxID=186751 RepID=UPI0022F017D9|nr:trypsin epsilon-like [Anopheles moucheti]